MQLHPADHGRAWIEIDLEAVTRNARALSMRARVPLLPMVKDDAYGLGAVPVARALEALDPWGYGVVTVAEGEELRGAGIGRRVLMTCPAEANARTMHALRAAGITPSFGEPKAIRMWMMTGGGDWHLSVDTGMNYAGVRWDEVDTLAGELGACPPSGAFTHFHSAELDDGSMEVQAQRFRDALDVLPTRPQVLHVENSAAIVRAASSEWTFVRPGAFIYGVARGGTMLPEPAVHLRARVVDIHDVPAGESVSYDATWTATRPSRIATLGAGYATGCRRALGNKGSAILHGRRVPVVGALTMNFTMVDVTGLACERGDVATLIGADGDELIVVNDVAAASGLSPYEILTALRSGVPRVYV
ncbi:MAG: alanine racemase [Gemmatimonadaceae bacterium]|nr:alanine racemase [Gemmatimonadaceae bacterium]